MKIVGYCDNPNNYFFGTEITERLYETEKEECGMRTCRGCFYFVSIYDIDDGIDKMDIEDEWDSFEKDEIANEMPEM